MDKFGDQATGFRPVNPEEQARSTSRFIKLKIPKFRSFEAGKEKRAENICIKDEEEHGHDHICGECGKGFKSGKALGGHKRIHMQNAKKFQQKPKTITDGELRVIFNSGDRSTGEEVSCCVCGKKFLSMKALYGHMRFHPGRGWRGVQPPARPGSSSSTLSDDHQIDSDRSSDYSDSDSEAVLSVVDLKESLKGWSVTGMRGRRRSTLKIDANPEEDMQEAVNDLLMLANGEENLERAQKNNTPENFEERHDYKILIKRKKKRRRLSDMEKEANREFGVREKHVCVTCNKSFPSHHALGGHRSSHNKPKNGQSVSLAEARNEIAHGSSNYTTTTAEAVGLASAQGSNTSTCSNGDHHQCNICHKSFPTGQALGGHKRCHWEGPIEATSSSSQATEITHETLKAQRIFNIDLNELPPEEDDESD